MLAALHRGNEQWQEVTYAAPAPSSRITLSSAVRVVRVSIFHPGTQEHRLVTRELAAVEPVGR